MTDTPIPEDIIQAAEAALDNLLCNDIRASGTPDLFRKDCIHSIARAILAERQRSAAPSTGIDFQRIPPGTPVQKVGGYPFPGTVVAAFQTLAGNERFVVEATGEAYSGMLHIFNGGQLRAAPKGGEA